MSGQAHRIRRHVVELTVSNADVGLQLQAEMRRIMSGPVAQVVEASCDAAGRPERLDRIPSVAVDLGRLDARRLESDVVTRLSERLPVALAAAIASATTRHEAAPQPGAMLENGHGPDAGTVDAAAEVVLLFAATGSLPWWADVVRPDVVPEAIAFLALRAPQRLAAAFGEVATDRAALRRIVRHLEDASLVLVVHALARREGAHADEVTRELATLLMRSPALHQLPDRVRSTAVWIGLVSGAVEAHRRNRVADPWGDMLDRVALEAGVPRAALTAGASGRRIADFLARHQPVRDLPAPLSGAPDAGASPGRSGQDTPARARAFKSGELEAVRPREDGDAGREPAAPRSAQHADHGSERAEEPVGVAHPAMSGIPAPGKPQAEPAPFLPQPGIDVTFGDVDEAYVGNAGLVILAPFVTRFFTRLGLVGEASFVSPGAAHRAASLLHTVATGDPEPPEYQLVLPKVLCGIDPSAVLDAGEPPTEVELAECEFVLGASLGQAPALGRLSPAGLRSTFLLRRGVLRSVPGAWQLGVERETFDVLLDRLPWSFGWVKFPWMDAPLEVDW